MQRVQRTTWIVCSIVVLAMTAMAQSTYRFEVDGRWTNGVSEPWMFEETHPRDEVMAMQRRWADLESNLRTSSDHRWAGDFFEGSDTHGDYLRWSSKGGFVWLKVDKCRATVMSFSYGKVLASPASIQLIPEKTISGNKHHKHTNFSSVKFLPVSWSKDLLLVPQRDIASFGDYVAGLGRYNEWINFFEGIEFFSRTVEDDFPVSKEPIVPSGYERFIKSPLEATIVSVGKTHTRRSENPWWDDQITPVTIKLNRIGARPNLKFRMEDSDEIIALSSVTGRTAIGRIVRSVRKQPCVKYSDDDDCSEPEYSQIRIGTKASTRLVTP